MTDEHDSKTLLARVDERTKAIQIDIIHLREEIKDKTDRLEDMIKTYKVENDATQKLNKKSVDDQYVSKETFIPVQRIVYGVVAIILTSVFGALLGIVILK